MNKIFSAAIYGLDSQLIEVEADLIGDSYKFIIVGLPDTAVQEAKERVRSAIKNSGLAFPRTKVIVNLAPADLKKTGPVFDLPIALAVLIAKKVLCLPAAEQPAIFIGELSLTGELRPINGALSVALLAKERGYKKLYLPQANAQEANLIDGLEIYPVENLKQLINHLKNKIAIGPLPNKPITLPATAAVAPLFASIKGQWQAKRALAICASGNHNLLMSGPPGSGKTMLARSLTELLPALNFNETLEVTKIYSVAGLLGKQCLITNRPFRSPHHTASSIALVGGGSFPKPGEITLAHRGVLFLDELPEFPRAVLENLRQPLEDGLVTIARANQTLQFPARFTLVAALNPCPCGYLTDPEKDCKCTTSQIFKYQKKISGPLLDRFDLQIEVPRIKYSEIKQITNQQSIEQIIKQIKTARQQQVERFHKAKLAILTNSEIPASQLEKLCPLDQPSNNLIKEAMSKFHLSMRSYHKIIKIARTIADLEQSENIKPEHVAEALQFRVNPAP